MDSNHLNRIRNLTRTLLISGGINVLLLAAFFYFYFRELPPNPYYESKPVQQESSASLDRSNKALLHSFRSLPVEKLLTILADTQHVEEGYTKRDLALAALVAFHQFDLSRALLGQTEAPQARHLIIGKTKKGTPAIITVYPGLSEELYQEIIRFANTEKWPFTSKGLFALLRKQDTQPDPSLIDAFSLSPEFLAMETLFSRSQFPVAKEELIAMLREGDWNLLSEFVNQQKISQDLSPVRRQRFLLDYINRQSKTAAYLLLRTEGPFASKKIDDHQVLTLLNLLTEKTREAEQFALIMLTSPRSDAVWQAAANRLYEYAGVAKPEEDLRHAALAQFVKNFSKSVQKKPKIATSSSKNTAVPKLAIKKPTPTLKKAAPAPVAQVKQPPKAQPKIQAKPKQQVYIVQEGDSLWKIANRFKVDVPALKKHNQLTSDALKPGTSLKIPA